MLNIKQAASLLNVSEVSLRRWTDGGRLPCLRVGGRRERRFRREDLLAFLDRQDRNTSESIAEAPVRRRGAQIDLAGITIDYGAHLCALYESDLGRIKLSVPFLADGLRCRDVCFLIAHGDVAKQVIGHLQDVCSDFQAHRNEGRLKVLDGMSSGARMYEYFEEQFVLAARSGTCRLRVLGDMAWFFDRGMGIEELMHFEQRYNHGLAHRFPIVSLCQYDARRFSGIAIVDALKCHEDTFSYPLSRFLGV